MKFTVNERCVGCGLCASICPECFVMGQDGLAFARHEAQEGMQTAKAEEAMTGCPVDAIEKLN